MANIRAIVVSKKVAALTVGRPGPPGPGVQPYANLAAFPAVGVASRLYLAEDSGLLYSWDGAAYAPISGGGGAVTSVNNQTGAVTVEPVQTPVTQNAAETGTDAAIGSWSVLRVWQAIAAKVAAMITAGTVCAGNDSRLSNARTPTAHKSTHATGGGDALTPTDIGAVQALVTGGGATSGEVYNSAGIAYIRTSGAGGDSSFDSSGGTAYIDADTQVNSATPEWEYNGAKLLNFTEPSVVKAPTASVAFLMTDGQVQTLTPTSNFELLLPPDPVGAKTATFLLKIRQGGTAYSITAVKKSDGGTANYTHWLGSAWSTSPPALAGINKLTELIGEWDTGISKWLVRFGIKES